MLGGHPATGRSRTLPTIAAAGRLAMPAPVYLAIAAGTPEACVRPGDPADGRPCLCPRDDGVAGHARVGTLRLSLTLLGIVDDVGAAVAIALTMGL